MGTLLVVLRRLLWLVLLTAAGGAASAWWRDRRPALPPEPAEWPPLEPAGRARTAGADPSPDGGDGRG